MQSSRQHRTKNPPRRRRALVGVATLIALLATTFVVAQSTDELTNPAPGDWPTYGRNLQMWRYSPLDQINRDNVGDLRLAWSRSLSTVFEAQFSPVEYGGLLYINAPDQVIALDATNGEQAWVYKVELDENTNSLTAQRTRGSVVVYDGKVFATTGDGRVVALDAKTGDEAWSAQIGNIDLAEGFSSGPIFADGKIIVGPSGGDTGGSPGRVIAMDVNSGEILWTFHTVPQPGDPGFDTWQPPSVAQWGGASAWVPGAYDPDTKTVIYGVGQPIPWWAGDQRQGKNLYSASWVALDVDTGELKWYHQIVPNDEWDGDQIATPLIADVMLDGQKQHVAILPTTNGFIVIDDAATGKFLKSYKMMPETTYLTGFQDDGTPIIDDSFRFTEPGQTNLVCALRWVDFEPAAYSPDTGLYYRPNTNDCENMTNNPRPADWQPGTNPINASFEALTDRFDRLGAISAIDPSTGDVVWEYSTGYSQYSGPVATAGGLVFAGFPDRGFRAFDDKTGDVLWQQILPAYIPANPITYDVDGTQYVAVPVGGPGGIVIHHRTDVPDLVTGDVSIFVFALPGQSMNAAGN